MSQPTVNSRPATWSGTSAPILYKFTSTNYANAGYRMEVEIWDNVAAAKIADAKYYANGSGAVTVDVSAFLRSNMSLDLEADLTSGTVYQDVNWINYYIKYQEVWTASSETQVNDSANPRWAIYGGVQLGNANDFSDYVDPTFNFLTLPDECTAIVNYNFLFGFIVNGANQFLRVKRYANGSLLNTTDSSDFSGVGAWIGRIKETSTADRIDVSIWGPDSTELLLNGDFALGSTYWSNVGTGVSWSTGFGGPASASLDSTTNTTTKNYVQSFTAQSVGDFRFKIKCYTDVLAEHFNLKVSTYTGNTLVEDVLDFDCTWVMADQDANEQDTGIITVSGGFDRIYIKATITTVGLCGANFSLVSVTDEGTDAQLSETKTINILEDCNNIVMLAWRNSLGGWESYPFTYNQEYTWDYGNGKKAKRLTLFAENLTLTQWEAINGLNTTGQQYRNNITEMTTSLNRTSSKVGQSVYVLNSDGSKTGVVVINQTNVTQTKQQQHSAVVTIEYPETFLQ